MTKVLKKLLTAKGGATGIEYALIASLISLSIIGGATLMGNQLTNVYQSVANQVSSAIDGEPEEES